jgi:hypothetical protein
MDKRSEIISMVERRRHWPAEGKLRIVEEALAPGAVMQRLPTAMVSAGLFCAPGFLLAAASLAAPP